MIYHMRDHVADNTEPYELAEFKAWCWVVAAVIALIIVGVWK